MFSSKAIVTATVVLLAACSGGENNEDHDNHDQSHSNNSPHDGGNNHGHDDMGHGHEGDTDHHQVDLGGVDLGEVTITPAAEEYCECLLITCHDPFHDKYGADDAEAIAACQREAAGFPVAGTEQMSGDSIECRQYHCDNATGDSTCENALGAACM